MAIKKLFGILIGNMKYNDLKSSAKILKALANQRRLAIVTFLKRKSHATVGQIAEEIDLSFRATSRHLSVLSSAEILDKKQRSLQVFYFLSETPTPLAEAAIKSL